MVTEETRIYIRTFLCCFGYEVMGLNLIICLNDIYVYNCRCTSTRKKFIAIVVRWLDAAACNVAT
jgi:hypothetical protein